MTFFLPKGFVYLKDVVPDVKIDIKYATEDNFIGKVVPGYIKPICITIFELAKALARVQKLLMGDGFLLKILDVYRLRDAMIFFKEWVLSEATPEIQAKYHPNSTKSSILELGYISENSDHSTGSAVAFALVDTQGVEVNMGTMFDFFDKASHTESDKIDPIAQHNRLFLRHIMEQNGFKNLETEWWHYTLVDRPFKEHFNFYVQ